LDGSTWKYDDKSSTPIIQRTEGPVYDVLVEEGFSATLQSVNKDQEATIPSNTRILVFYDTIVNFMEGGTNVPV
jgi:hypothetical protein